MICGSQMYVKSKTKELWVHYFNRKKNAAQITVCAALYPFRYTNQTHMAYI